jgi:O-methyltransferase
MYSDISILDRLAQQLTNTMDEAEPDHDNPNAGAFVVEFVRHYIRGEAVTMLPLARLHNIRDCIAAIVADNVPGDVIETGVWRGGGCIYMRTCLDLLGQQDRIMWVADSFEGLPDPDPSREKEAKFHQGKMMQQHYEKMAASLDEVKGNFTRFGLLADNVKFLVGWFKDTLPTAPIEQLALMRLDGDYYESTMDGLTSLYPKLSPGGVVIIDDYGEDLWTDCRQAVDEFRAENRIDAPITVVDSKCVFWRKPF